MAGSTQEEWACAARPPPPELINPDVAIVLECPPADDTPGFKAGSRRARSARRADSRLRSHLIASRS
jgi:putative aminopeptidase FrvX